MTPRCFALLPLAGLILGATVVKAAPVTYQLKDWGSYLAQTHLQGSITVDASGTVPEPSSVALVLAALAAATSAAGMPRRGSRSAAA
jgi:hypothetical protein